MPASHFLTNLFDKSVLPGLDAAKAAREFYKLSAQLTEEQVIEQVATNYYQVLVQRQQIAVVDSTIKNTQKVQRILPGTIPEWSCKEN